MKLVQVPSPNYNARTSPPSAVILHATASGSETGDVEWCRTPPPKNPKPVSYHVIIGRTGTVYVLVDGKHRAWHAGGSELAGRADCNTFALGLAWANRNNGREVITEEQLAIGAAVVAGWMRVWPDITLDRIETHAAVRDAWRKRHPSAEIKTDPCRPFDLEAFRHRVALEVQGGGCP